MLCMELPAGQNLLIQGCPDFSNPGPIGRLGLDPLSILSFIKVNGPKTLFSMVARQNKGFSEMDVNETTQDRN